MLIRLKNLNRGLNNDNFTEPKFKQTILYKIPLLFDSCSPWRQAISYLILIFIEAQQIKKFLFNN